MDKQEHGTALKAAMARQGLDRQVVADAAGVGVRTVTNWTTGATLPSAREREVLCLMSEGLSNPEIASRLFVSRRTVTTHIEHIFAKLDVHGRTEAALYARDRGLC